MTKLRIIKPVVFPPWIAAGFFYTLFRKKYDDNHTCFCPVLSIIIQCSNTLCCHSSTVNFYATSKQDKFP
jgi:hypothetical protein